MIKPIPTKYKDVLFRSRLEARWSVFFEKAGLKWEYEKQGFVLDDGVPYLPDFWLPDLDAWCEVKPFNLSKNELSKCKLLAKGSQHKVILAIGIPGTTPTKCVNYYRDDNLVRIGEWNWEFILPFDDTGIVQKAFEKARLAHFEHGQSG